MYKSKFGKYIVVGAVTGALVSLFDRATREQVTSKSKTIINEVRFYSKNPDVLKIKFQEETDKYRSMYEQFTEDASFIKEKVSEIKELTPQVKEMVNETKDAFAETKEDYQSIISGENTEELLGK